MLKKMLLWWVTQWQLAMYGKVLKHTVYASRSSLFLWTVSMPKQYLHRRKASWNRNKQFLYKQWAEKYMERYIENQDGYSTADSGGSKWDACVVRKTSFYIRFWHEYGGKAKTVKHAAELQGRQDKIFIFFLLVQLHCWSR